MKKKKTITIFSILILLLIGGGVLYHFIFEAPKKEIAKRCFGYVPEWENFIACHGAIVLTDGWLSDYISVRDHLHGYTVTGIDNMDQYLYADGKVFVINRHLSTAGSSVGMTTYYQELLQNGEIKTSYYDSISDIPIYLVIDSATGEVKGYLSLNEVPENYRQYFSEIKGDK